MKTWLQKTYALIDTMTISKAELARQSKVSERWLHKLIAREMSDPSINRVEKVFRILIKENRKSKIPTLP